MSQIILGTSSTPSVPTSFLTDSGTAVPAANVLKILGADTTDNNINGIRVIGSGNTSTVQLTNRFYATDTTVDTATADLITFTLDASIRQVYSVGFKVVGRVTADRALGTNVGDGLGYNITSTFKTDGNGGSAVATRINTPYSEEDEDDIITASQINLVASGNTAILRVTGTQDYDIIWACSGEYLQV